MEKAKTELLETSCRNLILIPLPTRCVTLGQSLNIWDLQSLRIPISSCGGAERGREALNVSLTCRNADHALTITTVLIFLLYLLFYHVFSSPLWHAFGPLDLFLQLNKKTYYEGRKNIFTNTVVSFGVRWWFSLKLSRCSHISSLI